MNAIGAERAIRRRKEEAKRHPKPFGLTQRPRESLDDALYHANSAWGNASRDYRHIHPYSSSWTGGTERLSFPFFFFWPCDDGVRRRASPFSFIHHTHTHTPHTGQGQHAEQQQQEEQQEEQPLPVLEGGVARVWPAVQCTASTVRSSFGYHALRSASAYSRAIMGKKRKSQPVVEVVKSEFMGDAVLSLCPGWGPHVLLCVCFPPKPPHPPSLPPSTHSLSSSL